MALFYGKVTPLCLISLDVKDKSMRFSPTESFVQLKVSGAKRLPPSGQDRGRADALNGSSPDGVPLLKNGGIPVGTFTV